MLLEKWDEMKELIILSSRPGAGVNTIAVNLAVGLARQNYRVHVVTMCEQIVQWLTSSNIQTALPDGNPGLIVRDQWPDQEAEYILYIPQTNEDISKILQHWPYLILCVVDGAKDDLKGLVSLNYYLQSILEKSKGIDLIIPNKIKPGDWDSMKFIDNLAQEFGWDQIADSIPFCEAIHDLLKENKSVWDLPKQYSNRQAAFLSLVEKVIEL